MTATGDSRRRPPETAAERLHPSAFPAMVRLRMTANQIVASLSGVVNDTEADLVWLLVRHEVARAGLAPAASPARLTLAG